MKLATMRVRRLTDAQFSALQDPASYRILDTFGDVGGTVRVSMADVLADPTKIVMLVFETSNPEKLVEAVEVYDGAGCE